MLARMLLDDEHHPAIFWARRIIAGSIVGVIAYFALWGAQMDGIKKSVIMCTAGACAPEAIERARKFFKGNDKEKSSSSGKRRNRK